VEQASQPVEQASQLVEEALIQTPIYNSGWNAVNKKKNSLPCYCIKIH
jgi:hypothetical protein